MLTSKDNIKLMLLPERSLLKNLSSLKAKMKRLEVTLMSLPKRRKLRKKA